MGRPSQAQRGRPQWNNCSCVGSTAPASARAGEAKVAEPVTGRSDRGRRLPGLLIQQWASTGLACLFIVGIALGSLSINTSWASQVPFDRPSSEAPPVPPRETIDGEVGTVRGLAVLQREQTHSGAEIRLDIDAADHLRCGLHRARARNSGALRICASSRYRLSRSSASNGCRATSPLRSAVASGAYPNPLL